MRVVLSRICCAANAAAPTRPAQITHQGKRKRGLCWNGTTAVRPTTHKQYPAVAIQDSTASSCGHKMPTPFESLASILLLHSRALWVGGGGGYWARTCDKQEERPFSLSPVYNSYDGPGGIGSNTQALKLESPKNSLRRRHVSWIRSDSRRP